MVTHAFNLCSNCCCSTNKFANAVLYVFTLLIIFVTNSTFVNSLPIAKISIKGVFAEREYGFAKGRRKMKESDMDCAVREFYEETRIDINDIQKL